MCEKFFMMFEPQLKGEDEKKKKTNNFVSLIKILSRPYTVENETD